MKGRQFSTSSVSYENLVHVLHKSSDLKVEHFYYPISSIAVGYSIPTFLLSIDRFPLSDVVQGTEYEVPRTR